MPDLLSDLGLKVAQVRVIFSLPAAFGKYPHPLAYVEWFTPLRDPDPATGMHIISRSTQFHRRNAAVIPANWILRNCHLIGKCARKISREWTADNVLESTSQFYLNNYYDIDFFALSRL
jgi:hypothetical protein